MSPRLSAGECTALQDFR